MSLNVTYDQCYYGIVKMRDETEARIHLLHIPLFFTRPAAAGREIWKNGESRRGLHSAVCRPQRGNGGGVQVRILLLPPPSERTGKPSVVHIA